MRTRVWLFAAVATAVLAGASGAWAESGLIDAAQKNDHAEAMKRVTPAAAKEKSEDGGTALMWAAFNGDAELAEALVKAGADVKAANLYGATPMREAATSGSTAVLKVLLDAGADADSPTAEARPA